MALAVSVACWVDFHCFMEKFNWSMYQKKATKNRLFLRIGYSEYRQTNPKMKCAIFNLSTSLNLYITYNSWINCRMRQSNSNSTESEKQSAIVDCALTFPYLTRLENVFFSFLSCKLSVRRLENVMQAILNAFMLNVLFFNQLPLEFPWMFRTFECKQHNKRWIAFECKEFVGRTKSQFSKSCINKAKMWIKRINGAFHYGWRIQVDRERYYPCH